MRPTFRTTATVLAGTLGLTFAAGVLAGCGDDEPRSSAPQFCEEARSNTSLIVAPPMGTEAELDETLDFYRLMGELAPIAIAEQWNRVLGAMETAASVVPGDVASEQLVAKTAYAMERSAYEVKVWMNRNCGVDLPITTIAPQDPVPAQTVPVETVPGTGVTSTTSGG